MTTYQAPIEDMAFVLRHIADLDAICALENFETITPDDLDAILEEAGRFTADVIAPTNRTGDTQGSTRNPDGSVTTPDGFKAAYDAYVQSGWGAAPFEAEWGGGSQPWLLGCVFSEMLTSANMAFSLCPLLTQGAIHLLQAHGTQEQKSRWLPKLISGEWSGTMNLTEPQAGSDLGALAAKAVRQDDGSYRLSGQKIFITWGEHDLTDNIVHLVLARTPDAAPGTKGISCFIAPKFVVNPDGSLGQHNDIHCVSTEHKLGIHASPTCVLQYGENSSGTVAEIIGEEQQGMRYMFTMMNNARLGVGIEGLAISEKALQQAMAFAQQRLQGRTLNSEPGKQVPIAEHPDVKRMLLTMKAVTEAMRCLLYYTAAFVDRAEHSDDAALANERLDLLTPLCKAWCTDWASEIASLNIQIHGGMGYVEETGAAQNYRDIRIAAIYEGTNGIQALDLIGRKLPIRGGAAIVELLTEVAQIGQVLTGFAGTAEKGEGLDTAESHKPDEHSESLVRMWPPIAQALEATTKATQWLAENPGEPAMAGATPYLKMLASLLAGWLMAKSALTAKTELEQLKTEENPSASLQKRVGMLKSKILTAEFFCTQILPTATALLPATTAGDKTLAALEETP